MARVTGVKLMLLAQDMDRAVRFYADTFGLALRSRSRHWSELGWGGWILALHGGGGAPAQTGLSFAVDDLDGAVDAVVAAGGQVVRRPHRPDGEPVRLADVIDPEGNGFMLSQEVT